MIDDKKKEVIENIFNRLRDNLRNSDFSDIEIEHIVDDDVSLFRCISDILRERYRKLTPEKLLEKGKKENRQRVKKAVEDVLREQVRGALKQSDYYSAWKHPSVEAKKEVLNENKFDYIKKWSSVSSFVCHFTNDDKKATNIKSFLELYNISTFVDHVDASNYGGAEWEEKFETEIRKRPIFLLIAVNKPPSEQIKKEIDLNESLESDGRLRVNLILEPLSDNIFGELKIDKKKQYIVIDKDEKEEYNYLINSIWEKYFKLNH
jgi:hypothetical protein